MYLASASELGIEKDRVNTSYHRYLRSLQNLMACWPAQADSCLSEKEEIEVYVPEEEVAVLLSIM